MILKGISISILKGISPEISHKKCDKMSAKKKRTTICAVDLQNGIGKLDRSVLLERKITGYAAYCLQQKKGQRRNIILLLFERRFLQNLFRCKVFYIFVSAASVEGRKNVFAFVKSL